MKNFYLRIQRFIEKDLNEYVKWVILIGLYVFYRMMEQAYSENQLVFMVIPLIFLSITVFISSWIIKDMVGSVSATSGKRIRPKSISITVAFLFYLSILLFIIFYTFEWVPLINLAVLSLLSSAIVARYQDVVTQVPVQKWNKGAALILILLGASGAVFAILYNNYLNVMTFVFYISSIVYYFLNLYFFKGAKSSI